LKPERNGICAFCFKDLLNISVPGLKLLPPWTGSAAATSHFERMAVELAAMQPATAHLGAHPTPGAAFCHFSGSSPRQQLLHSSPSTGPQSWGQGQPVLAGEPRAADSPLQLASASLVASPTATTQQLPSSHQLRKGTTVTSV